MLSVILAKDVVKGGIVSSTLHVSIATSMVIALIIVNKRLKKLMGFPIFPVLMLHIPKVFHIDNAI